MQIKTIPIVLTLVLSFTAPVVQAQKNGPAADNRDAINRITQELGLNEKQQSKVEAILNKERKKVEAIFNEERKKLQSVQEETRSSLKAVLTPEQMDKLDKKMRQGNNENNNQQK
ncbi:MAG: hypothetical protein KA524_02520 [Nitrosomonas sp.]|nr:hypothetical protein [Nitrosomonas sp.]MBP6075078.1 hypothetical protein [Nitrosomonas sp.]